MATIKPVLIKHPYSHIAEIYKWEGMTEADTAVPVVVPHKADKTAQVIGDFGTGGEVEIHGAIPPDAAEGDYQILDDSLGNPLSFTAAEKKPKAISPNTYNMKPEIAAGTGVLVDVYLQITP